MAGKSDGKASVDKENIIHRLKEVVICSVCRDTFKDPKVLPCSHSFCASCIENVYYMSEYRNCVVCPVCRHNAFLFDNAISNFPRNTVIQEILDILKWEENFHPQSEHICGFCKDPIVLNICMECSVRMCKKCTGIHNQSNNNSHTVLLISEIQGTALLDFLNEKEKYKCCPDHGDKEPNRFCETCDKVLCNQCVILHNGGHTVSSFEEAASDVKEFLASQIRESRLQIKALRHNSDALRGHHDLLDSTTKEAKHQIQTSATELRQLIDEKEQECTKQADDIHRNKSKRLQDLTEAVEIQLVKRTVLLEKMKSLYKFGTSLLLAKNKKAISNQLEELKGQPGERVEQSDQDELKITFSRNAKLLETVKQLNIGKIKDNSSQLDLTRTNISSIFEGGLLGMLHAQLENRRSRSLDTLQLFGIMILYLLFVIVVNIPKILTDTA